MSEINQRMTMPGTNGSRPGTGTPGSMFPGGPMPPAPGQGMPGMQSPGMSPDGTMRPGQGMGPGSMPPGGTMRPGQGMDPGSMPPGGTMRPGQGMGPGSMPPGGTMRPGQGMGPGPMPPGMNMQGPGMNGMMPGNIGTMSSVTNLCAILRQMPHATAVVRGSSEYPDITGRIMFYQMRMGVLVAAEVFGLPGGNGDCDSPIFGFHIHSGSTCSGNMTDPFADALEHYNPEQCMHPQHAGDMPPLFGNNGYAFQVFLTDRFTVREIMGRTVIIHSMPDDFRSQPGGNSGTKIACGQILGREAR